MAVTASPLDKEAKGFTTLNTSRLKLAIASYSLSGFAIRVVQLPKVVTHCGQPQRFGKLVVMLYQRLSKEAPELFAFTIKYSKLDHYARECRDSANNIVPLRLYKLLGRSFHRVKRPLIIFTWSVNGLHDRLIALNELSRVHSGLEVQGAGSIIS